MTGPETSRHKCSRKHEAKQVLRLLTFQARILNMYVVINTNVRMSIKTKLCLACQDEHDIGDDCAYEDGQGDCDANCDGDSGSDGDGCGGDDSPGAVGVCSVEMMYMMQTNIHIVAS